MALCTQRFENRDTLGGTLGTCDPPTLREQWETARLYPSPGHSRGISIEHNSSHLHQLICACLQEAVGLLTSDTVSEERMDHGRNTISPPLIIRYFLSPDVSGKSVWCRGSCTLGPAVSVQEFNVGVSPAMTRVHLELQSWQHGQVEPLK